MRRVQLHDSYWSASTQEPLLERSLGDLLRDLARDVPDRIALVDAGTEPSDRRRWSYRELLTEAERIARALLARFAPGDHVAIWAPNSAEWIFFQLGASLAGLVLVTVNPAYLEDELEYVLRASGAVGLAHTESYRGLDHDGVVRAMLTRLPKLRHQLPLARPAAWAEDRRSPTELPRVRATDVIQIQFTSGTTGKPKGACLHHLGVINAAAFAARRAGFPEGGVWASAMPLFHVGGSFSSQVGAYSRRGTYVMQPAFDAGAMLELIETERVQHLHAVPAMLRAMLEHPDFPVRDLSSLGTIMSGGSPVPAQLVRRVREAFGCKFTITYGQTEMNGVICQTDPDDDPELQASTIGQPAPHMEVKIADPGTGAVLPLGESGEIWGRGYQTMRGYYDLPAGADPALRPDGWLSTGDLGRMDSAGYVAITGRLKDCIIRGGENIYPREVEDVLETHPGIREASVVGLPDERWGEAVAAVLRLDPGEVRPSALDLHEHCRAHLARFKTPAHWFYVRDFPRTPSGKIQKFRLRELVVSGALTPEPFVKPARLRAEA